MYKKSARFLIRQSVESINTQGLPYQPSKISLN